MKKFGIAAILFFATAYGYEEKNTYGKEVVDSINVNGSLFLDGTKVRSVQLNGYLEAKGALVDHLEVNGQVNLKNCQVNEGIINGLLTAENSKFQKELSVASQKVVLVQCNVENLTIKEVHGFDGVQIIDLRNGTKVHGKVVVESGKGEVWLSSNSEVNGVIEGAKIK